MEGHIPAHSVSVRLRWSPAREEQEQLWCLGYCVSSSAPTKEAKPSRLHGEKAESQLACTAVLGVRAELSGSSSGAQAMASVSSNLAQAQCTPWPPKPAEEWAVCHVCKLRFTSTAPRMQTLTLLSSLETSNSHSRHSISISFSGSCKVFSYIEIFNETIN